MSGQLLVNKELPECIFEGKMDAAFYIQILESYLVPFIVIDIIHFLIDSCKIAYFPFGTVLFLIHLHGGTLLLNHQSHCNPIENVWHEMRE
jgi:uncharacterized membrane protein